MSGIGASPSTSFQFHVGTIARLELTGQAGYLSKFQFHVGTIARTFRFFVIKLFRSFQFHVGTIARTTGEQQAERYDYFNSTLVRLRGTPLPVFIIAILISIPRWYDCENEKAYFIRGFSRISIPRWYDCEMIGDSDALNECIFQFHVGTIASVRGFSSAYTFEISIPRWYDCEA